MSNGKAGESSSARQAQVPVGGRADEVTNDGTNGDEAQSVEVGGREGPDPTRYGDWEKNGRCIDF